MTRAYYNENNSYAAEWLRNLIAAGHITPGDVDERDIRDVSPEDVRGYTRVHWFAGVGGWEYALQLAGWPDDLPVWSASLPCQPYSSAGRRQGEADERHLWPVFFDLLRQCRPDVCFGEQVASAIGHGWLDGISDDLEEEGYACGAVVLPACSVGAPHLRQRLWWVADSEYPRSQGESRQGLPGTGRAPIVSAVGGVSGKLADANHTNRAERALGTSQSAIREKRHDSRDGRQFGRLAEPYGGQRQRRAEIPGGDDRNRKNAGRAESNGDAQARGSIGGLGNSGGSGAGRDLGAAFSPETGGGGEWIENGISRCDQSFSPGAGSWDDFILIPCLDGKARRIKRGLEPLAHGVPGRVGADGAIQKQSRVGMLRAYGNAIVPQVAAEVINAWRTQ